MNLNPSTDSPPPAVAVLDSKGKIVSANYNWGKGFQGNPYYGRSCERGIVYVEHCRQIKGRLGKCAGQIAAGINALLKGRERLFQYTYKVGTPHPHQFLVRAYALVGATGESVVIEHHDITSDETEKERLRESARKFREILRRSTDILFIRDLKGRYAMINPAGLEIFKMESKQVLGRTHRELFGDKVGEAIEVLDRKVLKTGKPIRVVRKSRYGGTDRQFQTTLSPYLSAGKRIVGVIGISRDITSEKLLEEELRHSQKMEAVGRLAGGVAHDLNNLFTAIRGYSDLVMDALDSRDPRKEDVREIVIASERAAALITQLVEFGKRKPTKLEPLDLNVVITGARVMLRRLLGESVELDCDLDPDLKTTMADQTQLIQVLLNLSVNAREAMSSGGKVVIRTRSVRCGAGEVPELCSPSEGPCVLLSFSDSGSGMSEEVRSHVFEPFYSTKEKGSGLGLATVYSIVKQCRGKIAVKSRPGSGTTILICLPQAKGKAKPYKPISSFIQHRPGSETIMIAEDEKPLLALLKRVLTDQGYKVLSAPNGVSRAG